MFHISTETCSTSVAGLMTIGERLTRFVHRLTHRQTDFINYNLSNHSNVANALGRL